MKDAGIITLHFSVNYGAVLQCFALSETLKKNGIQVNVINYYPDYAKYYWEPQKKYMDAIRDEVISCRRGIGYTRKNVFIGCLKALKYVYKQNKNMNNYLIKYNAFKEFSEKHLILTKEYNNIEMMKELPFDVLITGSDQVWNSNYTNYAFDKAYFLKFGRNDAIKIAYGVSTYMYENERWWTEMLSLCNDFDRVSLREKMVCAKINGLCGAEKAVAVLDPSLLLTADEWCKFESCGYDCPERYVLTYCLHEDELCLHYLNEYISSNNIMVIDISPKRLGKIFDWRGNCGPDEFLYLVHNAEIIITDSFHGTTFSVIYNKNFISINTKQSDTRILDFLKLLDLDDRCKNSFAKIPLQPINYEIANKNLKILRENSLHFLLQGLT